MTIKRSCADVPSTAERGDFPSRAASRRSLLLVLAAALAVCLLAACGSGPSPNSAATGAEVTIGKAVDTIGFTTVDVAGAKGFFAKQNVAVTSQLLGGSSTAFAALQSGGVQFVTASATALLAAKAKGVPIEAVTSLDYGVSLQMIASNDWIKAHNLSTQQPLDTVMKGLSGATIGVISTTDLAYNRYLSQAAGVDPNEFKTITFKTQAAALAALQHGQIDAFLLSPPNSFLAQAQGGAQIIATLHSVPELSKMTYDVLVVASDYAKTNPEVVKSVATAMAMADQVMLKDPNSVLDVEKAHYPAMSDDVLLASLKYVTFAPDGKMTAAGWQAAKEVSAQTGVEGAASVDVSPGAGVWSNDYIKVADLSATGGGS